jgi:L-2-hydroxyglutarate oxidase
LDASFRELAAEVIRKHSRRELVRFASALAEAIRFEDFTVWGKAGIRAQLLDTAASRLAMGFVTEDDDHSLHVLNVVSPAFTCAPPFAEHVCDIILSNLR